MGSVTQSPPADSSVCSDTKYGSAPRRGTGSALRGAWYSEGLRVRFRFDRRRALIERWAAFLTGPAVP